MEDALTAESPSQDKVLETHCKFISIGILGVGEGGIVWMSREH